MQLSAQLFADIVTTMRAQGTGAGHEKRRTTRIDLESKVQVSLVRDRAYVQTIGALTRDVSLSGIGFLLATPIQRAQEIIVQIPRCDDDVVHLACNVMHCRSPADSLYIVGAEFARIVSTVEISQMRDAGADELHRIQRSILI